jgi:hypothetical protein
MLPVTDIEFTHFPQATIDDEWIFIVICI